MRHGRITDVHLHPNFNIGHLLSNAFLPIVGFVNFHTLQPALRIFCWLSSSRLNLPIHFISLSDRIILPYVRITIPCCTWSKKLKSMCWFVTTVLALGKRELGSRWNSSPVYCEADTDRNSRMWIWMKQPNGSGGTFANTGSTVPITWTKNCACLPPGSITYICACHCFRSSEKCTELTFSAYIPGEPKEPKTK